MIIAPTAASPRAQVSPRRAIVVAPWTLIILASTLGALAPDFAEKWGAALLLLSGLCFGMPHGAGDWLLMRARSRNTAQLARLTLLYLLLALAVAALWWVSAAAALWFFLALTAWHWGSGDAHWLSERASSKRPDAPWLLFAIGRGALVMAAPLAFHARQSAAVLTEFSQLTTRGGAPFPVARALSIAPYALGFALTLSALAWFLRRQTDVNERASDGALIVGETALLLLLFCATPPLFAVTVYFAGVHAWRHILRIEALQNAPLDGALPIARAVVRFHLQVAPVTALVLLGLAPLIWLWPRILTDALALGTTYLILISALTLPHALAIIWLDWRN